MSKRSILTHITPLPDIGRETAVAFIHNHKEMIEMNPLVIRHAKTSPPSNASSDEALNMTWYELTDEIQYIPGTAVKGEVSYKAGFYDLPQGLQTHVFAPGGVDIRGKWSVGGNMPGEEREPAELGVNKPIDGLYIREEVDLRCNVFLANFVKRNLKKSHGTVVERLVKKAGEMEAENPQLRKFQSVKSASPENIVMQRNSLITSPVPYHQLYVPSSNLFRNPTPNSNASQMSQRVCSCLGTRHHPACQYFIDIYQQSDEAPLDSPASDPPRSVQPSRTATWESTPTSAYSRTSHSMCFCTGGVHQQGCPSYPGLRFTASRSISPPIEDSQQPPYQITWAVSNSRTPTPETQRPPSNGANSFRSQIYDRQVDSPESTYYRSIEAQRDWPNPELKPQPLMTRTAHGHAVLTELEGDMAQRYYEYQASRATGTE
jgi:hypothetical protein